MRREVFRVAVMPGGSFGDAAKGHIRISLCQPEEILRDAAARLKRPVKLRVDYRLFTLRGEPIEKTVHRVYAGINLAF